MDSFDDKPTNRNFNSQLKDLIMIKFRLTFFVIVMMLTFIGCSKSKQELLIGHWECNGKDKGMKFSGTVEYVSNGKSNTVMEMSGSESGVPFLVEVIGQGTWKVNDVELIESIEKLTVTRFSADGKDLPPDNFPQEMKNALVGVSSGSEIIQLDDRMLITKNADTQITCSRK